MFEKQERTLPEVITTITCELDPSGANDTGYYDYALAEVARSVKAVQWLKQFRYAVERQNPDWALSINLWRKAASLVLEDYLLSGIGCGLISGLTTAYLSSAIIAASELVAEATPTLAKRVLHLSD